MKHYSINSSTIQKPSTANFQLHTHEAYEVYLFLDGDASYIVEDKTYSLEPFDIIVIRKDELHGVNPAGDVPYSRIPLHILPSFFTAYNCKEYEACFLNSTSATGNKIPAAIVHSSGLYDAFMKYKKYSDNFATRTDSPILTAIIIEILYLVNQVTEYSVTDVSNGPLKEVIMYLNTHYTEEITLDMLEETFFLSKYYLCKAFRKTTGLTLQEYIRLKRLAKVRDLRLTGATISEAATAAGFTDYSSFYRAYKKEYGVSPRENMRV